MSMNTIVEQKPIEKKLASQLKRSLLIPGLLMVLVFVLNQLYKNYFIFLTDFFNTNQIDSAENVLYCVSLAFLGYWLFVRATNQLVTYLLTTDFLALNSTIPILLPFFSSLVKVIFALSLVNLITPSLGLPIGLSYLFSKVTSILIISAISWVCFKLIAIAEQLLLKHYTEHTAGDVFSRKMCTQTLILKRIATGILAVLTAGAILMLFDNVRALGASVLTTAGIFGLVITFTAQRSLGSIFSGLEIALTQPIKIGDTVVVENEHGIIEEINFRSVVIKLWDWRRLVVPTSYFLEKPFQNWSREQNNNLIGTVFLYADFTLSVDDLRAELADILDRSALWDKKIQKIQVSDLQSSVMQLRILVSAASPADAWDLRCEVREKLMDYIVKNQQHSLPMSRSRSLKQE